MEKVKEDFASIIAANRALAEHARAKKGRRGGRAVRAVRVGTCPTCGGDATVSGTTEVGSYREFRCRDSEGCDTRGTWTELPDGTLRMQVANQRRCVVDGCGELTGSQSSHCPEHRVRAARTDYATRLLPLTEVADRLGVSVSTVRHLISTGALPSVKVGRRRLVQRGDLKRFVLARSS